MKRGFWKPLVTIGLLKELLAEPDRYQITSASMEKEICAMQN